MYNRNNNRPGRDLPFYFTSSISSVLLFVFFKIRVQLVVRLGMCSVESITLAKVKSSTSSIDKLNLERSLAVCQPRPLGLLGIFQNDESLVQRFQPSRFSRKPPVFRDHFRPPIFASKLPVFLFFSKESNLLYLFSEIE